MNASGVLIADKLQTGYGDIVISDDLNLALQRGQLVCLIGPNGAGKTTLMRTLAGMLPPLAGQIHIEGQRLTTLSARQLAQRLSVVLTDRVDVGTLSGYALVALGRHPYTDWSGRLSAQDEGIVRWAVRAVSAEEIAPRPIHTLSDGERQKLMIARALAQEPAVMILDEPTAFLDLPRRVEIMQVLKRLARETQRAILLSTHDLDLALRHADRIGLMSRDGVLQIGAPEDLVLSGAFERVFRSEGVQFDPQTGSFTARHVARIPIKLRGEGLRYIWTQRALERAGFAVAHESALCIIVRDTDWLFASHHYTTIADLIAALEEQQS